MRIYLCLSFLLSSLSIPISAQMTHEDPSDRDSTEVLVVQVPNGLNGSGTSWIPQVSPMHALHFMSENWMTMIHGNLFLRYTGQNLNNPDKRGEDAFGAPNWFMVMAERELPGGNRLQLRSMLSADYLTEGGDGYPLLFQTGETWRDEPLIDRQHPHDLFMELALILSHSLGDRNSLFLYLGYPGEPALGPTAFMHRPSAEIIPDAVLGHHNQDATHITFGVATLGVILGDFKVDGSIFTGREPDETRWDFDSPRFDSYALRLAYRPSPFLTTQASAGYIHSPEVLDPDADRIRFTASSIMIHSLGRRGSEKEDDVSAALALIYGGNLGTEEGHRDLENSFTLESQVSLSRWIPYMRYEVLQREPDELGLEGLGQDGSDEDLEWIHALTLGSGVKVWNGFGLEFLLGIQGTLNAFGNELEDAYGRFPLSFGAFLQIRPMGMTIMEEHENGQGGHGGHHGAGS